MRRVVLHVDRLVLRGVAPGDRHAVARGLQAELARQLAEPGAVRSWVIRGDVAHVAAGVVRLEAGAPPSAVGEQAARAMTTRSRP